MSMVHAHDKQIHRHWAIGNAIPLPRTPQGELIHSYRTVCSRLIKVSDVHKAPYALMTLLKPLCVWLGPENCCVLEDFASWRIPVKQRILPLEGLL